MARIERIAFIGLGIMGSPIAANLMKAGFELHVWARRREQAEPLIAAGAIWHDSVASVVRVADAVITMLGEPKDVESVWLGKGGLMETARRGAFLIDMTTSSPSLAARLHKTGAKLGLHVLDCPVTGGRAGAESGKLALFVGGKKADFDACAAIWQAVSARASYMGPAGSGQAAKAANQIAVAGVLSGVCESLAYARAAGLDLNELFPSLCAGSAGSKQMEKIGAKILARDDTPSFFVRYLAKDLRIGVSEAASLGVELDVARDTLANLDKLTALGMGDLGTQALVHNYENDAAERFAKISYDSPVGVLTIAAGAKGIIALTIAGQKYESRHQPSDAETVETPVLKAARAWLDRYFAGKRPSPAELLLDLRGTEYQLAVWNELLNIPYGRVITYGALAEKLHSSPRAVASTVGRNPISIIIPCHRVIGKDGELTGYAGGIENKRKLLQLEGAVKEQLVIRDE